MERLPLDRSVLDSALERMDIADIAQATIRQSGDIARILENETGTEFLHLEMGVPGLPPEQVGVEAECKALRQGVASQYPSMSGIPELKEQASRFIRAFLDIGVAPQGCIPTVGSMQGSFTLFLLCSQLDPKKNKILFIDPGFPVQRNQVHILNIPHASFDIYEYRAEKLGPKLESYLTQGDVAAIVYSNPNNPAWICLTEEELRTLANAVFVKKQTSLVRDMFLFGCFTGLSYIDIKTLTHDKIQRMDFDGEEWIITRRTKTRVSSNVPLMEIAKELIERYRGLAGGDLVFPMPSNSVCNRHLKQIAKACGIHKEIGFHLSRHTFATTVYLCNGGTIEALSKILGHKHISTTQIYAEVTNRMVSSDFRAISGNLAAMQRSVLEKKDRRQDGKRVRRSLRETA